MRKIGGQFKYIALKADFEEQILSGKLPFGSLFPSEREIQEFGMGYSRNTIRMAIKKMLTEGILLRMKDRRLSVWDNRLPKAKVKLAFFYPQRLSSLNDISNMIYRALLIQCRFLNIPLCYFDSRQYWEKPFDPGVFNAVFSASVLDERLPVKTERKISLSNDSNAQYFVSVDDYQGGVMAADFLKAQGCSNAVFINYHSHMSNNPFQRRGKGFSDRCRNLSLPCQTLLIPNTTERSIRIFLLSKRNQKLVQDADGIFFSSDYLAINMTRVIQEIGLTCASNPSTWIGFDGGTDSEYLPYPLNTLKQPIRELAQTALNLALSPNPKPEKVLLQPQLIIRCPDQNSLKSKKRDWRMFKKSSLCENSIDLGV